MTWNEVLSINLAWAVQIEQDWQNHEQSDDLHNAKHFHLLVESKEGGRLLC